MSAPTITCPLDNFNDTVQIGISQIGAGGQAQTAGENPFRNPPSYSGIAGEDGLQMHRFPYGT